MLVRHALGVALVPAALLAAGPAPAHAQIVRRVPVVVVDARGLLASLGADVTTAFDLGLDPALLSTRAWGGLVGAHVYPWRGRTVSLGVGVETLFARTRAQPVDGAGEPIGPPIERRLHGVVGMVSLNFGGRDGWSYLSGGIGPVAFATFPRPLPSGESLPRRTTQHFGGGARWFRSQHVAAAFDVRFYLTRPQPATPGIAGRDRQRLVVISVGISLR